MNTTFIAAISYISTVLGEAVAYTDNAVYWDYNSGPAVRLKFVKDTTLNPDQYDVYITISDDLPENIWYQLKGYQAVHALNELD